MTTAQTFQGLGGRGLAVWRDVLRCGPAGPSGRMRQDHLIRRQVSSAVRLDVVGLTGGVGCSHVAARLGVLLAWRRGARVLGVDAGLGATFTRLTQAVAQAAAETGPAAPVRRLHASASPNRTDEATAGMLVGMAGLRVAPVGLPGTGQATPADWRSSVAGATRFFDVVVTDWGHRVPGVDFETSLAGAHAVALVCRTRRSDIESAIRVAQATARHVPCLVCAVDVDGTGAAPARAGAGWGIIPVVAWPFLADPAVPVPPAAARAAVIDLAAKLMGMAADGPPPADTGVPTSVPTRASRAASPQPGGGR